MSISAETFSISKSRRYIYAGIIGNILEHYDTALFGLLAPFLAPLFFPTFDPLNALILTYAILPLDILSKPLGSLVFGHIGDRLGRKQALSLSIIGTAVMTGLMGCIPTYHEAGIYAVFILTAVRILQKMCAAGECIGGAIFILEHHEKDNKGFLGSLYSCSTVLGILLASAMINCFDTFGLIHSHWRWLFWAGFVTSGIGLYVRYQTQESPEFLRQENLPSYTKGFISTWEVLKKYRKEFLAIAAVSGFSYSIYEMALVFLNGYLPLVSDVSSSKIMGLNTLLLGLDMAILPVFGWISDKQNAAKHMFYASLASFAAAIPLLALCDHASYLQLLFVRTCWVILGVWFCAPFHAWSQDLIPVRHRYTIISLGYAIGSQLIGAPAASIGFWLYKHTQVVYAPAYYIMFAALLAMIGLYSKRPWKV